MQQLTLDQWCTVKAVAMRLPDYDKEFFDKLLSELEATNAILPDKKTYSDSDIRNKIDEAKQYLILFGVPEALLTKITLLTFLALCKIPPDGSWTNATGESMTLTKGIMHFVSENYGITYKPNTRETFRRDAINVFLTHRIIDLNPNNPNLGPNSPLTHYAISEDILSDVKRIKV